MVKSKVKVNNWLALFLIPVLLVTQAIIPSRIWFYMLTTLVGMLVLSFVWTKSLRDKVRLERRVHRGIVQVGDTLEERFTLANDSFFPLLWAEISDLSYLPGYDASHIDAVGPLDEVRWRSRGRCIRRGLFELGATEMRLGDPFGLFSASVSLPNTTSFMVYPPLVELPNIELPRGYIAGSSLSSARSPFITTNASGVRQYAHGDSLNRIHWPTTARLDDLYAKEFDLEPSGDLWIVLDLEGAVQAGEEAESTQEYGIILAASLASQLIKENRGVGLVAYDKQVSVVPLEREQAQLWRILQALVMVRELGDTPLEAVLAGLERQLGLGSSLLVITPSCRPEWLSALKQLASRGIMPMVIFLDAGSFGAEADVAGMKAALDQEGIGGYLVSKGFHFSPLWRGLRWRKASLKSLPSGRTIPLVAG